MRRPGFAWNEVSAEAVRPLAGYERTDGQSGVQPRAGAAPPC